jgi:site-specific recombinase XerD
LTLGKQSAPNPQRTGGTIHHPRKAYAASNIEYADQFLATLASSPHTASDYKYALGKLVEFVADTAYLGSPSPALPFPIAGLRDDLLLKFDEWMIRLDYKLTTRNNYLAAVKRFLTWLDANDRLPAEFQFAKAVNRVRAAHGNKRNGKAAREPDPGIPRIVTYYDAVELPPADTPQNKLKRLEILRARAIVHTLYASAGRVSEVASLTREMALDGRAKEIRITGKGDKDRVILLTKEAQAAIAAYCRERNDEYPGLFISHGRGAGKSLGRWTLWRVVKDATAALDLYKGTSPHAFRHYRAQSLLDEGMELTVLQVYLGHADVGTTRKIYAPHTDLGKVRSQLSRFGKSASEAAQSA